jgi:hypothetical protein
MFFEWMWRHVSKGSGGFACMNEGAVDTKNHASNVFIVCSSKALCVMNDFLDWLIMMNCPSHSDLEELVGLVKD